MYCLYTAFCVCLRNYVFEYGIPSSIGEFPCWGAKIHCMDTEVRVCLRNSLFEQVNMKFCVCSRKYVFDLWNFVFDR